MRKLLARNVESELDIWVELNRMAGAVAQDWYAFRLAVL